MAMQKLKNIKIDFSDRRTQLVVGGVIAVVIIVIVLVLLIGRRGASEGPSIPAMQAGMMGNMPGGGNMPTGIPGMGMGANMPVGNMPTGMPGIGMMGMMGGMGGPQAGAGAQQGQVALTRKVSAGPPKEPSRADPFSVPVPKGVREALARVDVVPPPRITPLKTPMPTMVYTQVPFTGVVGVTIGQGVSAILEGANGRTYVVSPGDVVEGFTVERIEPTGVVLRTEDGQETFVGLRSSEGGMMPGAGMPGMGMPGMGGMPGAGGMPGFGMPGMGMPGMGGMPGAGGVPGMGMPGMGMPQGGVPGMPRGRRFRGQ